MENKHDVVIIGGGIAGLTITELFSRSGHNVLLIESKDRLCSEASGSHHGWFHFGSLYAIFPKNNFMRTLVGGLEDLMNYYSDFEGMNLSINNSGKLNVNKIKNQWIRNEPISYLVASRNNEDFNIMKSANIISFFQKLFFKLTWEFSIKQFISRHNSFTKYNWKKKLAAKEIPMFNWFNYSKKYIGKPSKNDFNFNIHSHFLLDGFDRPMNPINIIKDLIKSLFSSGGKIELNCTYKNHKKIDNDLFEIYTSKGNYLAKKIIFTSGKNLKNHLHKKEKFSVMASPLVVIYPAVSNQHIVRLTPFVDKTINHLHHEINGIKYSVVGGGYVAPADDDKKINEIEKKLKEITLKFFKKIDKNSYIESYISYKTELIKSPGERNYQYIVKEVEDNIYTVIPGKFTLSFSAAIDCYKKIYKKDPSNKIHLNESLNVDQYVGNMRHADMVLLSI